MIACIGLFDGNHAFTAHRAFDDGVHRRLDGLPGRDPLRATAAQLIAKIRFHAFKPRILRLFGHCINIC